MRGADIVAGVMAGVMAGTVAGEVFSVGKVVLEHRAVNIQEV